MTESKTVSPVPQILSFALPGILPQDTVLYLDQGSDVVALFQHQEQVPTLLGIRQLTPTEFDLLVLLVRAYPALCPYERLYQAILPRSFSPQQMGTVVRPLRRSIAMLQSAILLFGIRIVALRNQGYFLRQFT